MKKVRFEIQIPENDELMMKANEIIHRNSGWVEEDGEIPAPNIENDEYFGKLEYSVDLTRTDVVLSTVANTMNDVFSEVSEIIIDEIPKMTDSKNKSIIAFEIIVPDKAGNDAVGFCEVVRETLHKHFKDTSDYVDSNVIVWSTNGEDDEKDTIIESGASICLDSCIHKEEAFEKFTNAYFDVVGLPEYFGIVFGRINKYEEAVLEKIDNVSDKIRDYVFTMDDLTAIMILIDKLDDAVNSKIKSDDDTNDNHHQTTDTFNLMTLSNNLCVYRGDIKKHLSNYDGDKAKVLVGVSEHLKKAINLIWGFTNIDSDEDGEEQSTVDHVLADLETLRNRMNDLYTDRSVDARELINMLDDFITNYNN